ncbi:ammonia-forming cytochrome c nitrite reductase subunit c552 [Syntrophomonas wolfei]|jgi:nitrite reductase (cytochrome c-552)|uniref:ammonia-forming cytochrome c nitrite reductase subunit c552 n=1 Tax=Syntrophomonas wolfei TaxID=863 RepID=UPI0023F0F93F|nr:ammonia-forming cytochrome c nitrite reductase subunit c552 [Syntrophomonas wolfei]
MKNDRVKKLLMISVSVLLIVLVAGIFFFNRNNKMVLEGPQGEIAANETSSQAWAKFYPAHWDSYQANYANTEKPSHFAAKPYLTAIYAGFGFAKEYNEPRAHVYTIEDILAIDPARKKAGASCFTCKSTQVPEMMQKYGEQYYLMTFDEIKEEFTEAIGCLDCHEPKTMELRLSRPALIEALQRQGRDVDKISQQEMRSLVCAQCHVTYYFQPGSKKITFPWDKGVKADQILAYYDEMKFSEWTHPDAGSGMVKPRHAEYETFQDSTHESAGLSCADCHMPYTKVGSKKISSHVWQSPLNNIEQSCTTCHRNGIDWLTDRVKTIQSQVKQTQDLAGEAVVEAINELKISQAAANVDQSILKEAQELHRQAQWYLDFVVVTNGYGFHNPTETLNNLGTAIDAAHKSAQKAREARGLK